MTVQIIPWPADTLAGQVQALFPVPVAVAVTDPARNHPAPPDIEAAAVATARRKRRREFFAGRAAVRQAMRQMGRGETPVPMGPDRAPVWPEALTGSISHSDNLCIAVLADRREAPAIGLDIEPAAPLDDELVPEVCTWAERAWLSCQPLPQRRVLARLIFSAKECAYKCQYGLSKTLLEFHDLEITTDVETGQFEATFLRAVPQFDRGAQLCGRYAFADGHIITAIAAEHPFRRRYPAPLGRKAMKGIESGS